RQASILRSDPQPWPEPVEGAVLLDEIVCTLKRYLALSKGAAEGVALWVMYAWTHEAAEISPILNVSSPEKQCGKTTMFEILAAILPRMIFTSNITPGSLFRIIERD